MTNVYEEVLVIGDLKLEETQQPSVIKKSKKEVDGLIGDLNPRYHEEKISLEDARQKVYSSHFIVSGNFNIFNPY